MSNDLVPVAFDYGALAVELRTEAQTVAKRIRNRNEATVIENGRDLLAMKAKLKDGTFGQWIAAELNITPRTAQNYMRAAEVFGGNSEIVSLLPPTTVYLLAAKSTPSDIREGVVQDIKAGKPADPAVIGAAIREAMAKAREAKQAEIREAKLAKLSPEEREALSTKHKRSKKYREQQAARQAREQAEQQRKNAQEKQQAEEIAGLIAERLGDDLRSVISAMEDVHFWHIERALKDIAKRPQGIAEAA